MPDRLTKFDDYPIHQTTHPIARTATSDRNAYDRFWFNGYQDDGAFYLGIGAAVYPNLGIMDCGFSLVIDGEQHAFHASRRAPQEPSEVEVGPFHIEILEPMKSLRVTIDENETGISCDLLWIPRSANFKEGHQASAQVMEATRFNQFGHWKGTIRYAGKTLEVDPRRVYGTKDRSWGFRPVGDPYTGGAPPTSAPQILFLWAPLQWEGGGCTHAGVFENQHGIQYHWDGMLVPTYDDPSAIPGVEDAACEPLLRVEHELHFVPGLRRASAAHIVLHQIDGKRQDIDLEVLLTFRMKGIGYSHPEWGHGKWKGELAVGGECWKTSEVDDLELPNQHMQQVVRARRGDEQGIGVLEQIILGPHRRYGFTEFLDPAS